MDRNSNQQFIDRLLKQETRVSEAQLGVATCELGNYNAALVHVLQANG